MISEHKKELINYQINIEYSNYRRVFIMKKSLFGIAIAFVFSFLLSVNVIGEMPIRILIDGERLYFPDAQPFIDENGRTQTPARFIGEGLGAVVTWDGNSQKATFKKDNTELVLYIGKRDYEINGQIKQMDTAAILKDDRTFVPARYVAEAFGATVRWDGVIRTVYIDTVEGSTPEPTPAFQGGTIECFDGIAFNSVTDVDQYGRMTVEKSKEFVLKLANQLEFVKENGKYYIKCEYPEIPKDFQWFLRIRIFNKDGSVESYTPITRVPGYQIPREGSFKKEATIAKMSNIEGFGITIFVERIQLINPPYSMDKELGSLDILYLTDGTEKRVDFVHVDGSLPNEEYTSSFDFGKMFKW